ncbi:helix-turn-helix domain-containing protein [Pseudomonas sp. ENNP23]|uniref:helix-turn-helix domain-containing protein n=1 Tax=Pseudomonas sp. ENNP23 TaxID=1535636 RepID=UPI00084B2C1B|nr:helix-turn-helix domain-containing protein [Pseudomonas sp. ENNP23]OEC54419.1 plasmid-related protein [Pseudomonas sp. ENNP23]
MATSTEQLLMEQFNSPLLSLAQVAQILNRSPQGLRITLSGDNEIARKLGPARKRIGKRVLFRVSDLAQFIDEA